MLIICIKYISEPSEINFCIEKGQFPDEWKRANVVPVRKKGDKKVSRKNFFIISNMWKNIWTFNI